MTKKIDSYARVTQSFWKENCQHYGLRVANRMFAGRFPLTFWFFPSTCVAFPYYFWHYPYYFRWLFRLKRQVSRSKTRMRGRRTLPSSWMHPLTGCLHELGRVRLPCILTDFLPKTSVKRARVRSFIHTKEEKVYNLYTLFVKTLLPCYLCINNTKKHIPIPSCGRSRNVFCSKK